jgi:hypothetical protein
MFYLPEKRKNDIDKKIFLQLQNILPLNSDTREEQPEYLFDTSFTQSEIEALNLPSTQLYGEKFMNLLTTLGIDSNELVHNFVVLLYEEYFKAIGKGKNGATIYRSKENVTNIRFIAYRDPIPEQATVQTEKFSVSVNVSYSKTNKFSMNHKYANLIPLLPKPAQNLKKKQINCHKTS